MQKMRLNKKDPILAAFVLALMFPILTQQVFTEENANYVYPTIEFDAIQLNATAYRFHSGNTLNFTFTLTTKKGVRASCSYHYTYYNWLGRDPPHMGRLDQNWYRNGEPAGHSYSGVGIQGEGRIRGKKTHIVDTAGNHTINWNWLLTIDGDGEGYLDVNFVTEVKLKIESPDPIPIILLAIGAGGAGAAIVGAKFFLKRRRNEQSSSI